MTPFEAFKFVGKWSAGETHKRHYPHEEVLKLSEALMLLDQYFLLNEFVDCGPADPEELTE